MKYYFFSIILIFFAIFSVTIFKYVASFSESKLTFLSMEVPKKGAAIAGVQKVNLPPVSQNIALPEFSSRAILIKDLTTNTILFQKDSDISLPVASTTKVMTGLVASEYYKDNSVLIIGDSSSVSGSKVGFPRGDKLSFRSILYGMLLDSGNDAAYALAENYPGGVSAFVDKMNEKAKSMNLLNTHFDNPAGFDSPKHFSSAKDLAIITEEALKNGQLSRVFSTKDTDIVSLDKKNVYKLHNLNKLLSSVKGVLGVKTGYTEIAKENLISFVERAEHRVLVIVLGSNDRFGESTKLIEWTYQNFTWL